jgi:V-type H+-transporting ATPase proteolipid subunit
MPKSQKGLLLTVIIFSCCGWRSPSPSLPALLLLIIVVALWTMEYDSCPAIAPFLGYMGVAAAIVFASEFPLFENPYHRSFCAQETIMLIPPFSLMPRFVFTDVGAAHGTSKAGVGIMNAGIESPDLIWRNLIPVVMAGVNGIYGLITAIILVGSISGPSGGDGYYTYSLYTGAAHLAAGLCCGLSGLGSGMCIGIAGDAAVNACGAWAAEAKRPSRGFDAKSGKRKAGGGDKLFVSMVLIQVFAGNVALYGLIASILLSQQVYYCGQN